MDIIGIAKTSVGRFESLTEKNRPDYGTPNCNKRGTTMRRGSNFLEVAAMVCTIIVAVLAVADWMLKIL